jgi:hypothetical protein
VADAFGQSGRIQDLYAVAGIVAEQIVEAALPRDGASGAKLSAYAWHSGEPRQRLSWASPSSGPAGSFPNSGTDASTEIDYGWPDRRARNVVVAFPPPGESLFLDEVRLYRSE